MLPPSSPRTYLNGDYDYESAAGPFTPSKSTDANAGNGRVSDSSSMFGTLPSQAMFESVQPPFSVDGAEKEAHAPPSGEMPGAYEDTPKLSKLGEPSGKKKLSDASYFDADGELKETRGSQRDDVSIGEAF